MIKRIQEIHKSIEDLNNELEEIRRRCEHENYSEQSFMFAPAYPCTGMICDDCGKYLGEYQSFNEWIPQYTIGYLECMFGDFTRRKLSDKHREIVSKRLLLEANKDKINIFGTTKIPQDKFEEAIKEYL